MTFWCNIYSSLVIYSTLTLRLSWRSSVSRVVSCIHVLKLTHAIAMTSNPFLALCPSVGYPSGITWVSNHSSWIEGLQFHPQFQGFKTFILNRKASIPPSPMHRKHIQSVTHGSAISVSPGDLLEMQIIKPPGLGWIVSHQRLHRRA